MTWQALVNAGTVVLVGILLAWYLRDRFDQVDNRFEQVDKRIEQIDKRIDLVESRLGQLTAEIASLRSDLLRVALAFGGQRPAD